jgi:hypothetical protein
MLCKQPQEERRTHMKVSLTKLFSIGVLLVIASVLVVGSPKVSAKTFPMSDYFNDSGYVSKISKKSVIYATQTGSSPLTYGKTKTVKITSQTKFYKCKGYTADYNSYRVKKVKRSTAIKAINNNPSNYVFFRVKNGKVITIMYQMEMFVG